MKVYLVIGIPPNKNWKLVTEEPFNGAPHVVKILVDKENINVSNIELSDGTMHSEMNTFNIDMSVIATTISLLHPLLYRSIAPEWLLDSAKKQAN